MKKLIVLVLMILAMQAESGEVVCGSTGTKTLYPVNETAIALANQLGLKTCNRSDRFRDAMKAAGHTGKVIRISKKQKKELRKRLKKSEGIPTSI